MRPNLFLGVLALVLTAAPVVGSACEPTTSEPEVDTGWVVSGDVLEAAGAHPARFYIDNDPCQPVCIFSIWIYQETNGIDGLQRQDEVHDDTCGGMIHGDTFPCQLLPVALLSRRRDGAAGSAAAGVAALMVSGIALVPTADAC